MCDLFRTTEKVNSFLNKDAFQYDAYRPLTDHIVGEGGVRGRGWHAWQGACVVGGMHGKGCLCGMHAPL